MGTAVTRKDQRLEFRISDSDKELFSRAAAAAGVSVSTFASDELRTAAQRVLADRAEFVLSPVEWGLWEALNERPARELAGLRALMERPTPFID